MPDLVAIAQTVKTLTGGSARQGFPTIDTVVLDANLREMHELASHPIEHPIEPDGDGSIVDHVVLEPEGLSIECVVTNTPTYDPPSHANGAVATPIVVTPFSSLLEDPGQVISERAGAADPALGLGGQTLLPPTVGMVKGFVPEFDRVMAVFEELKAIREARKLVTIGTSLEIYDNMLITRVTIPRDVRTANVLKFAVQARKVRVVDLAGAVAAPSSSTPRTAKVGARAKTEAGPEQGAKVRRSFLRRRTGR